MFCNRCYQEYQNKADSLLPKPQSKTKLYAIAEDKMSKTPSIKNFFQN